MRNIITTAVVAEMGRGGGERAVTVFLWFVSFLLCFFLGGGEGGMIE